MVTNIMKILNYLEQWPILIKIKSKKDKSQILFLFWKINYTNTYEDRFNLTGIHVLKKKKKKNKKRKKKKKMYRGRQSDPKINSNM